MEKPRLTKVEKVLLQRGRRCRRGSLLLTRHHLIFTPQADIAEADANETQVNASADEASSSSTANQEPAPQEETKLANSLLWFVTRLAVVTPVEASGKAPRRRRDATRIYPLAIFTRSFESTTLGFDSETTVTDVFEALKASVVVESPRDLYAFSYEPRLPSSLEQSGWSVYDYRAELARQGVGTRTKAWRTCELNSKYELARTYPAKLCIPSRISDSTVRYAVKYRSKERIPALTYLHWSNLATITRSSQPLVGFNNRSMQDEKLVEAIFTSHIFADPQSPAAQAAKAASDDLVLNGSPAMERSNTIAIYGAQTTNLIIDARPTTNAMANRAKGAGTENMEHYKGCKKVYLGIDNIHVMRDSLQRVTDALRAARQPATFGMQAVALEPEGRSAESTDSRLSVVSAEDDNHLDHQALKRSGWLRHVSSVLEGTLIITRNVHINNSHVLVHCSDGWDRTSQLAALAQVCLDPFFRTMRGFAVLVEKDWVSFGHRFWTRCGHASSEKYFTTATDYSQQDSDSDASDEGAPAATNSNIAFDSQAAANAFWGFTKQITANFSGGGADSHSGKRGAHLKEISPIFHQFLDCVWQIMRQYPRRFEFNENWLLDVYDAVYECKYGTFLYDNEADRKEALEGQNGPRTQSVWDDMLDESQRQRYLNSDFLPDLDKDNKRQGADMGVLLPNSKDVGFWGGLFRWDQNDINTLVRAEAEERKRQVELTERLRRAAEEDGRRVATSEVGPKEVDGVTVGPIVSGAGPDPVLQPDAIPVANVESSRLSYQPRVRANVVGRAPESISLNKAADPLLVRDLPGAGEEGVGAGAQVAANRMRNMVIGWGTRLQDAYTQATAAPPEGAAAAAPPTSTSSFIPRVVEADYRRQQPSHGEFGHHSGDALPARQRQSTFPAAAESRPSARMGANPNGLSSNPWAAAAEHHDKEGIGNARPSTASSIRQSERARKDLPNTLESEDPWQSHVPAMESSAPPSGVPRQRKQPEPEPPAPSAEQQRKQEYDPLGVGLG